MFAFGILLNSLQLSELECPTEGGSFDPPGSDQRGLPQLGFVKLLPQLARIAAPYGPALERRTRYRSFRALREVRVEVRHPKCRPLHPPRVPENVDPETLDPLPVERILPYMDDWRHHSC